MAFDPTYLFLSLVVSGVGFVLFTYGRKQQRVPQLAAGVAFMAYPYFAPTTAWLIGIAVALGFTLWAAIRLGW